MAAFSGRNFKNSGSYVMTKGIFCLGLDPLAPENRHIVNVNLCSTNSHGLIDIELDFAVLRPQDMSLGNDVLIVEPANRGSVTSPMIFNDADPSLLDPADPGIVGSGFLMERGYSIAMIGWQPSYVHTYLLPTQIAFGSRLPHVEPPVLGARLPIARCFDGSSVTGLTREQFFDMPPGPRFTAHLAYAVAESASPGDLYVREHEEGERQLLSPTLWRYLDPWTLEVTRPPLSDFSEAALYELVYNAKDPIVYGLAFAGIRNLVSFLRTRSHDDKGGENPLNCNRRPLIRHTIGFGISQTARVLKGFLRSCNQDAHGDRVLDGAMVNLPGPGWSDVNTNFARPGLKDAQHLASRLRGEEFPFSYAASLDHLSGRNEGILQKHEQPPKIFQTDSENELWHGGSLTYVDSRGRDLKAPENVRIYAFAGAEHITMRVPGFEPKDGQKLGWDPLDYRPLIRALLVALEQWIVDGIEPPDSCHPTVSDDTLVSPDQRATGFPELPGVSYSGAISKRHFLDFSVEPPVVLGTYPALAPRVDSDGNMVGGIRLPEVAVPIATHTGWRLRPVGYDVRDLDGFFGMCLPFSSSRSQRMRLGDPRPSIEERYADEAFYRACLKQAVDDLIARRLLLPREGPSLVRKAMTKYRSAAKERRLTKKSRVKQECPIAAG